MLSNVLEFLPLIVAPLILLVWSLVSAYVLKFGLRGSGIGMDYIILTVLVALALVFGGAI